MLRWIKRPRRDRVSLERAVSPGQREATAALGRATAAVQDIQGRSPEVTQVAGQLRQLREHNHFAEGLYLLFRGGT